MTGPEMTGPEHSDTETIVIYEHDGYGYEIDHLGVCRPDQWGCFAVYSAHGEMLAEFALPESLLRSGLQPAALPVSDDELIQLARAAVSEDPR